MIIHQIKVFVHTNQSLPENGVKWNNLTCRKVKVYVHWSLQFNSVTNMNKCNTESKKYSYFSPIFFKSYIAVSLTSFIIETTILFIKIISIDSFSVKMNFFIIINF